MEYKDFYARVHTLAQTDDFTEAEKVTQAVIRTLGETISADARTDLASELPQELKEVILTPIRPEVDGEETRDMSIEAFCDLVGERTGTDRGTAAHQANAVMKVLEEAVAPGTMRNLLETLPEEYDEIFEGVSGGLE